MVWVAHNQPFFSRHYYKTKANYTIYLATLSDKDTEVNPSERGTVWFEKAVQNTMLYFIHENPFWWKICSSVKWAMERDNNYPNEYSHDRFRNPIQEQTAHKIYGVLDANANADPSY